MPNALVALATTTLGSTTSSVTFGSIPSTGFKDLRLVATPISSGGYGNMNNGAINGATGTSYSYVIATGNGSTTASSSGNNTYWPDIGLYDANNGNVFTMDFLDYAETDKHKTVLIRANSSSQQVGMVVLRYVSTSAINSIKLQGNTTFAAGSTFSLYGVLS